MLTRFSVLPDERRVLMGVDKDNLFKPGVVYVAREILGEIIITPLGEYVLPKTGYPSQNSDVGDIMQCGLHLLTKEDLVTKEDE